MRVGALTTSAPGVDADMILSGPILTQVGPYSVRVNFRVMDQYINRYFGVAINGILKAPLVWVPS
jgi:hypothetical protein